MLIWCASTKHQQAKPNCNWCNGFSPLCIATAFTFTLSTPTFSSSIIKAKGGYCQSTFSATQRIITLNFLWKSIWKLVVKWKLDRNMRCVMCLVQRSNWFCCLFKTFSIVVLHHLDFSPLCVCCDIARPAAQIGTNVHHLYDHFSYLPSFL